MKFPKPHDYLLYPNKETTAPAYSKQEVDAWWEALRKYLETYLEDSMLKSSWRLAKKLLEEWL